MAAILADKDKPADIGQTHKSVPSQFPRAGRYLLCRARAVTASCR